MRTLRLDCMQEIEARFGEHASHGLNIDKVDAGSFGPVLSGLERVQSILNSRSLSSSGRTPTLNRLTFIAPRWLSSEAPMETAPCFQDCKIFLEKLVHQVSDRFPFPLCDALQPPAHCAVEVDWQA